jgi:hypothetical protein
VLSHLRMMMVDFDLSDCLGHLVTSCSTESDSAIYYPPAHARRNLGGGTAKTAEVTG